MTKKLNDKDLNISGGGIGDNVKFFIYKVKSNYKEMKGVNDAIKAKNNKKKEQEKILERRYRLIAEIAAGMNGTGKK